MSLKPLSIAAALAVACMALPAIAVPVVVGPAPSADSGVPFNHVAASAVANRDVKTLELAFASVDAETGHVVGTGLDGVPGDDMPVTLRLPQDFGYTVSSDAASAPVRPARFVARAVSRVPEPLTWLMMVLGFGAIGAGIRARVRSSSAAFEEKLKRIAAGEIA